MKTRKRKIPPKGERRLWLPGDDDAPKEIAEVVCPACLTRHYLGDEHSAEECVAARAERETEICGDCQRQVYKGEHSEGECAAAHGKLEGLRRAGGHGKAWLPKGWNG